MRTVIEVQDFCGNITYYPGPCDHAEAVPVTSTAGDTVAYLCVECDQQLPAYLPAYHPAHALQES